MNAKQLIILVTGILVGFLSVSQFYSYRQAKEALSRDTTVSYANQLNLTVQTNEKLKAELSKLDNQLNELRTTANVYQVLEKDIERYELLTGKRPVTGPGITLSINAKLETFWIIDILNELSVSGAEAISINGRRITDRTGFVGQGAPEMVIYVNNTSPLIRPYSIQAIGDPGVLHQYLTQNDGIIRRLKTSLGVSDSDITIAQNESISIPETPALSE